MAANIQAYLENIRQPWGQIYYDILFEQLQDIKGKRVLEMPALRSSSATMF